MITKNQIKLIKALRLKKNRIQSGFFVAEGEKIVDELLKSDLEAVNIFSISEKYKNLKNYISINSTQLKQISNLKSPNNVIGIFKIPANKEIDFNSNIVALEEINDPGNLGTIIRLCDWFGIKNIICSENSVDCYNPKVVQSSMGSISRVSISYMEFDNLISSVNYNTVAADLHGKSLKEHIFSKNQKFKTFFCWHVQFVENILLLQCLKKETTTAKELDLRPLGKVIIFRDTQTNRQNLPIIYRSSANLDRSEVGHLSHIVTVPLFPNHPDLELLVKSNE